MNASTERVYLDNAATTPLDPEALDAMLPYLSSDFGNASSQHWWGQRARAGVELAREQVALLVGSDPDEIVFTSGATESINLALKGTMLGRRPAVTRLITAATEHKAVLDVAGSLVRDGHSINILPTDREGKIAVELVLEAMTETSLVSLMAANNETGVLGPIAQVAAFARDRGAHLHTDATQFVGKAAVNVRDLGVDLMSFSSHKINGPKGVGALYVKRGLSRSISPQLHGGGHERGLRSGTLNVPAIVGFGMACDIARRRLDIDRSRVGALRDALERKILDTISGARVNGGGAARLPNITNIHLPGIDADSLVLAMPDVAISSGSACTAATPSPSHVLLAMGLTYEAANESVRFSLGRFSTEADVDWAVTRLCSVAEVLRGDRSPVEPAGVAR